MSYWEDLLPTEQRNPKTWITGEGMELKFTDMGLGRLGLSLSNALFRFAEKPDSDASQIRNLSYELIKRFHLSKEHRTALLFWAMAWFLDDRTESPEILDTSSLILDECFRALPYRTLSLLSRKLEEALADGVEEKL